MNNKIEGVEEFNETFVSIPVEQQTYKNAMEFLVREDLSKILSTMDPDIIKDINIIEVITYALNRLPPLYASSEEGLERQKQRGKKEFFADIEAVVKRALEIVQERPVRFTTPLQEAANLDLQESKEALQELANWLWLSHREVSWKDIVVVIKQIIESNQPITQWTDIEPFELEE